MSKDAPWLALSVDWQDSTMFDEATHGERLAWICLLCHAKSQGRGGRVRLNRSKFQEAYRLTGRAVDGMLAAAQKCAAIDLNGEVVTLCNWDSYQVKGLSSRYRKRASNPAPVVGDVSLSEGKEETPPRAREPNPLWDSVAEQFFGGVVLAPQEGRVGKIVRDLKALGATPDELRRRIGRHKHEWPKAECSPESIVKHWARFDGRGGVARRVPAADSPIAPALPHLIPIPEEVVKEVETKRRSMSQIVQQIKQEAAK